MMTNLKRLFNPVLKAGIVAFLTFALTFNSFASDADRITLLEKEVGELKQRLSNFESAQAIKKTTQTPIVSSEGWRQIANWRLLKSGFSPKDVRELLGEPTRIDGGNVAFWTYPNRGEVTFLRDQVQQWREPQ